MSRVLLVFFLIFFGLTGVTFGDVACGDQAMVLLYHHFVQGAATSPWELNVDDFASQMAYLSRENYQTLSLEEFIFYHERGEFPPQSILLTFDDAYYSFYSLAYPILSKYELKAIVFPIIEFVPGLEMQPYYSKYLSFRQMRKLLKDNLVEFGSHSYGLHHFREDGTPFIQPYQGEGEEEYYQRILIDLRLSRDLLSLQLEKEIISLAWPYGMNTPLALEIGIEVGYRLFFCGEPGMVTSKTPLTCIPRYSITSGCLEDFKILLARF